MTIVREPTDNLDLVIEYLESHPDFFINQLDLLNQIDIPHNLGSNIPSLIEYQVKQLRKQDSILKDKLKYFQERHQSVLDLSEAIQEQQNIILNCDSIEKLYDSFYQFLNRYYGVNYLLYFVFVNKRTYEDYRGLRFRKPNSKVHNLFIALFNHNRPLCDCLQDDYLEFLFGKKAGTIRSTAVFPIQNESPLGLMITASRETDRFEQGVSLNLLNQLKSLFIHQLFRIIWN